MPRKRNRRKQIQLAKRKAGASARPHTGHVTHENRLNSDHVLRKSTDYHPSDGHCIRMNTLEFFRISNVPEVGDSQEAVQRIHVNFRRHKASREFGNAIFPGMICIDGPEVLVRPHETQFGCFRSNPEGCVLDGTFKYDFLGSDAFVFCMSAVPKSSSDRFGEYQSSWEIEPSSAKNLATRIFEFASTLSSSRKLSFRPPGSKFREDDYREARFVVRHGLVDYEANEVSFDPFSKADEASLIRRVTRPEFSKRSEYRGQNEYRFALLMVSGCKVLPLRSDAPLDVDPSILDGLLL